MRLSNWIIFGVFALMVGCSTTRYEYIPPTTDQGKTCAAQCGASRELCRSDAKATAARRHASCERTRASAYTNCLILAKNSTEKAACAKKEQKAYCGEIAITNHCDDSYRECYATCGGKVIAHEED